jgi:hypothetical protein
MEVAREMRCDRSRLALLGILALALSVTAGLTVSGASAAKKKKGKTGGTVNITKTVGAAVPDATANTNGLLASTIDVGGKKFKGTRIRDVNVTLSTLGSREAPPSSAFQLSARVTAPNGATTWLFVPGSLSGASIANLTLDDQTFVRLTPGTPRDATELGPPYAGTAQPDVTSPGAGQGGVNTFSVMDNGPVTGTWTLRVVDNVAMGPSTSILNSWRIQVVAGKPFQTK